MMEKWGQEVAGVLLVLNMGDILGLAACRCLLDFGGIGGDFCGCSRFGGRGIVFILFSCHRLSLLFVYEIVVILLSYLLIFTSENHQTFSQYPHSSI